MNGFNVKRVFGALAMTALLAAPVAAQNLFSPVVKVNDSVVTEYEIEQRSRFLRLLNAPGSTRDEALQELIDDRLRAQAVRSAGLELTQEGIDAGLAEFSSRANLSTEEFVKALGQGGVSEQSFRDFVTGGLAWRDLIRAKYGARVQITEAEIDRALAATGGASGIRVLLSEIIIPAPPQKAAQAQAIADRVAAATSEAQFSQFARQHSATASRGRGGRLGWQPLTNLPPALRPALLALAPGDVTDPIAIPNAIALFQLRGIEETDSSSQEYAAIEYAAYYIPGGRSEAALAQAAKIRARVDVCDDLYGVAQGQPEEVLDRGSKLPGEIPQDIAIELSKLDEGEVSTALTRADGQTLVFLMMCGRTAAANEEVAREDVASSLRQNRLSAYADGFLQQLRADARIVEQ
ncbi:MAG: peptidylprolyl isomerase [Sulfitobacter sp.]